MTSARIVYSGPARRDLDQIWDYIASDNPAAASELVARIVKKCQSYANQPELGEASNTLLPGCRQFSVGQYVIYYRQVEAGIELIRVLHVARNVDPLK